LNSEPKTLSGLAKRRYNESMAAQGDTKKRRPSSGEPADPVEAAAAYGIDVSQLRDNLTLTVAQRLRRHQIALDTVEMLQKARRP
jgi:hypothetical protein